MAIDRNYIGNLPISSNDVWRNEVFLGRTRAYERLDYVIDELTSSAWFCFDVCGGRRMTDGSSCRLWRGDVSPLPASTTDVRVDYNVDVRFSHRRSQGGGGCSGCMCAPDPYYAFKFYYRILILFYLYLFLYVLQPSFGGCVVKRGWLFVLLAFICNIKYSIPDDKSRNTCFA